ncbi:hypothetical protein ACJQWK_11476 [Exserohilum turcicum]
MASTPHVAGPVPDLAEAITTLQARVRNFIEDVKSGRQNFILETTDDLPLGDGSVQMMKFVAADEGTKRHLEGLLAELVRLEKQLRSREEWHPPSPQSQDAILPDTVDLADLASAVHMLRDFVTSSNSPQQRTPQPTLSAHSWTWDPVWCEFYTYLQAQDTYVFLSQWRLNEARNVWEHVNMAGTNLMPDRAAELLGAWEDWEWDAIAQQWYLDMGPGTSEKIQIFASPWQVQDDGEWVYVGTIGRVNT